jgi:hypothetical protein
MGLGDDIGETRPRPAVFRGVAGHARMGWPFAAPHRAFLIATLITLAGCSNGSGSLLIDPGRYDAYHCNDLAARQKVLAAREKELRELMARADQGDGGAVIGSLAYRTDYESVLSEERLLQRNEADKKCNFTPQFQSDQIIR